MVVPFPPGGVDPVARLIAPGMSAALGQPVVVDNRPGANGIIGSEQVMRAPADGHTIIFTTSSTMVGAVFLTRNLPFDPVRDFTPISNVYSGVHSLVAHGGAPFNNVRELVAYAKQNPGKLSYSSSGMGSVFHMNGESFKLAAGIDMLHVPVKGIAPAVTEVVAQRIDVGFPGLSNVRQFLGSGKVKVLAVLDPRRYARMPDVPSIAEFYPGFRKAPTWIAMFGPANMPRGVVMRLNGEIAKALAAPEAQKFMEDNYSYVTAGPPEELAAQLKADLDLTGAIVARLGLKPE
jgi:tripartite-type tricarboxylate transporter receptor subunit TctC